MNLLEAVKSLNQRAARENWYYVCDPSLAFSDPIYDRLLSLWRSRAEGRPMPRRSQMTPREAADRLFNRVMTAASNGDSAQAQRFLPMAVMAYQRVDPLDADGRYHLAALHLVGHDWAAARAQADTLLAASPTHLFGLFTAGEAEYGRGDAAAAKGFYRRFLAAYDAEVAKRLPEYEEHSQGLPAMRAQVVAKLGQ